ncbi:MAG: TonB-dependent receptor [Lentisphaerae bacterium]|nr:TonB-dependent receptor [Lentisphaerota bacterium]
MSVALSCAAVDDTSTAADLLDLSLEELMNVEVTSVAGVAQPWFVSPAAIYVLTGDDIRRSGHQHLAEALRLVPGMQVMQLGSRSWQVSARGFNDLLANKQLVLLDGRTIYDPSFAGVFWDTYDIPMEDIDRVEVIRGPGATLWGDNAVNGVINITTKHARDTQGLYLSSGIGSQQRFLGEMRYGAQISDSAFYRVWVKHVSHDSFDMLDGRSARDDWDMTRAGVRSDVDIGDDATLTLEGEFTHGDRLGEAILVPTDRAHMARDLVYDDGQINGGYVLARLTGGDEAQGWAVQTSYDRVERRAFAGAGQENDILDIDARRHGQLGARHEYVVGAGWKYVRGELSAGRLFAFRPGTRSVNTPSAFVQDTITLVEDHWFLMAGSKVSHNDYTGMEIQPSVRTWWQPNDRHVVWGAVSRPVRTPSRVDNDGILTLAYVDSGLVTVGTPSGMLVPVTLNGTSEIRSERLVAYEAGYRCRVTDGLTVDVSLFFNDYSDLVSWSSGTYGLMGNYADAEAHGVEVSINYRPTTFWNMTAGYTYFDLNAQGAGLSLRNYDYPHMATLRSSLALSANLELHTVGYYYDAREASSNDPGDHSFVRLDQGIVWRPSDRWEFSVWGRNLLDSGHVEATETLLSAGPEEVPREVFAQVSLRL